jgi:hypothetical protein
MCSQLRLGLGLGLRLSNVGMLRNGSILKRKPIKCGLYQDLTGCPYRYDSNTYRSQCEKINSVFYVFIELNG